METFLLLVFASLAALTALLELSKRQKSKQETRNRDFLRFRNNYVLVYALMMGAFVCPPFRDPVEVLAALPAVVSTNAIMH